jgi:peptidyl-prolyl cis-trans isomerase D
MFDFIRKYMRTFQVLLFLLIVPSFALLGLDGYRKMNDGSNHAIVKIDGRSVTQAEWDVAHREQVERIRRQMPTADAKMFDTPEMKQQSLDALIRDRVMLRAADKLHLATTDDRLQRLFATDPQFASLRNPDGSVNRELLAAQGMSSEMFTQRLRQDLSVQQVLLGVSATAFASKVAADQAVDAFFQQREAVIQRFKAVDYVAKVSPTDADLEKYYSNPGHAREFEAPEQVNVEYVVLDAEAMKKGVTVSDDELRAYYKENASRYTTPEERRASHILITADKSLPAADRAKARAKADDLLATLAKTPDAFAALATKNSQDPGSAGKGGDLDFFGRGAMVKPFEDVAFALKRGETSGVVETDFGFHIIRLTDIRGGESRSFESARAEIEGAIRQQLAQKRYADAVLDFTNLVYEQADSLKPVVDKFALELKTAQGVSRKASNGTKGPLASEKFLDALFAGETLRNKRNTDAIETAPGQLVAGRVAQYEPARVRPLTDVREQVRAQVVALQAAELARKDGEARLQALKQAPQTDMEIPSRNISGLQTQDLGKPIVDAVLRASPKSLPAFVGVDLGREGYVVAKVLKVVGRDPVVADPVRSREQYAGAWGDAETRAYYASLKTRLKVQIDDKAVALAKGADAPADKR